MFIKTSENGAQHFDFLLTRWNYKQTVEKIYGRNYSRAEELQKHVTDEGFDLESLKDDMTRFAIHPVDYDIENKIKVAEQSLKRAIKNLDEHESATHRHKHSMSFQIKKLIELLESEIDFTRNVVVNLVIIEYRYRLHRVQELFQPIFDILTSDYTQREKDLLLRPFKLDFVEIHNLLHHSLSDRLEELHEMLFAHVKSNVAEYTAILTLAKDDGQRELAKEALKAIGYQNEV